MTSTNLPLLPASFILSGSGCVLRMAASVKAVDFRASPGAVPPIYLQAWGYRVDRFAYTAQSYPQRLVAELGRG